MTQIHDQVRTSFMAGDGENNYMRKDFFFFPVVNFFVQSHIIHFTIDVDTTIETTTQFTTLHLYLTHLQTID